MAKAQTKALRWLFRKLGYQLQRLQRVQIHPWDDGKGRGKGDGLDAFEPTLPNPVGVFDVVLRTCAKDAFDTPTRRRFFDASSKEMAETCLRSLVRSVNDAVENLADCDIKLTIIDDHSDLDGQEMLQRELAKCTARTEFRFHGPENIGNGPSMRESYRYAKDNARDAVLCCEDDILFEPTAVREIIESYGRLTALYDGPVTFFPIDNPDDYRSIRPTRLVLGSHRHWRQTWGTTFTCVTSVELLRKYWHLYEKLGEYGTTEGVSETTTINQIYQEVPLFSPVPTLAHHMQEVFHMAPYGRWHDLWNETADRPLTKFNQIVVS